jgi:hypothetical protein
LLFNEKIELLREGIRAKINRELGPLTHAKIVSYYDRHRAQFFVGEQRDMGFLRTKRSGAVAARMRRELLSGVSYATLAKRYASEQPSYAKDGLLSGLEAGVFKETSLNDAIFAAKPGVVGGPVRLAPESAPVRYPLISSIEGYYLFTVYKIIPGHYTPLAPLESTFKKDLPILLEKQEVAALMKRLRPKWRAVTDCAPGFVVLKCRQYKPVPGEPEEDAYTLN